MIGCQVLRFHRPRRRHLQVRALLVSHDSIYKALFTLVCRDRPEDSNGYRRCAQPLN